MKKNKKERSKTTPTNTSSKRPYILRGIAASLVWLLLILAFINGTAARNYSNRALSKIDVATKFSETFFEEQKAIEVAKLFLNDFLNFTNREDYQTRMAKYSGNFNVPTGKQKVNSIYFVDKDFLDNEGIYRIILTVNLDREASSDSLYSIPTDKIISQNEIINDKEVVKYYKEIEETYIISVDKNLNVLGTPVIQPLQTSEGEALLIRGKDHSPEFKVFVEQVLDNYFKGTDLINFTSPEVDKILSIGNYEMTRFLIEGYEEKDKEARAIIKATVSTEGITYEQYIVIEAVLISDKWLLTRIGGW